MHRRSALALLGALLLPASRAQEIEVIDLRHRPAAELIPLLQPFVEPGGALTGQGFQLILRASAGNRAQIRQLLATLDRAPRQLLVTVSQDRVDEQATRSIGADGSVTTTTRRSFGAGQIQGGTGSTLGTRAATQSIRVMEGGRAYIAIGTAVPLMFRQYAVTRQGLREVVGTVYYDALTGFIAQPVVNGEQVTVSLSPEDSQLTARGIERARLETTVQGRLGEWIAVGGADVREDRSTGGGSAAIIGGSRGGSDHASGGASVSSQSRSERNRRGVWLKVEVVN